MSHIFISYSHSDRAYARKLADHLLANGFDVWIDDRIDFGSNWEREIFQAIDSCGAIIAIMSPAAYESLWMQRERQHAENRHKQAFPLLLNGEVFPFYAPIQYDDVRGEKLPPPNFLRRLSTFTLPRETPGQDVTIAFHVANIPVQSQNPTPLSQKHVKRGRRVTFFWLAILIIVLTVILSPVGLAGIIFFTSRVNTITPPPFTLTIVSDGTSQIASNSLIRAIGASIKDDLLQVEFSVINNSTTAMVEQPVHLFDTGGSVLASGFVPPLGSNQKAEVKLTVPLNHFIPGDHPNIYAVVGIAQLPPPNERQSGNIALVIVSIPGS